jgi:hypothetical protein
VPEVAPWKEQTVKIFLLENARLKEHCVSIQMNRMIFIQKGGQMAGPFDRVTIRTRLASGELTLADMASRDGSSGWTPLGILLDAPKPPLLIWRSLWVLTIVGLVVVIATSAYRKHVREQANSDYWRNLEKTEYQCDKEINAVRPIDSKKLEQGVLNSISSEIAVSAEQIRSMQVSNVDTELLVYSSTEAQLFDKWATTLDDMQHYFEDSQRENQDFTSLFTYAEAVMRGMLGDPLGKYNEEKSENDKLESEKEAIEENMNTLDTDANRLAAQKMEVRALLSRRYDREFQ